MRLLASAIGTPVNVFARLTFVDIPNNFSTTIPIYGLKYKNPSNNTGDYTINFNTDSGHTLQIYFYYSRCWYPDGSSSYGSISARWRSIGDSFYVTFFDDNFSKSYVDVYVTFKNIGGWKPQDYVTGRLFALVDSRDLE